MAENNGNNSATTVLISVIIVVAIGAAFYFGFVRGDWGNRDTEGVNIELNTPTNSNTPNNSSILY